MTHLAHRPGNRLALTLAVLSPLFGVLAGCNDISDRDIQTVSLADLRALTTSAKPGALEIIDPRAQSDYAAAHIPKAVNLQLADVPDRKDSLDPHLASFDTLVVYGDNPGSAVAPAMTKRLMRAGGQTVLFFKGGLLEWQRAGFKVESTPVSKAPAHTHGAGGG